MSHLRILLLLPFLLCLVACPSGGSSGSVAPAVPTFALTIASDRLDGGPNTQFALQAAVTPSADAQIVWDLGDGRSQSGQAMEVQYSTPGVYIVTATAPLLCRGEGANSASMPLELLSSAHASLASFLSPV